MRLIKTFSQFLTEAEAPAPATPQPAAQDDTALLKQACGAWQTMDPAKQTEFKEWTKTKTGTQYPYDPSVACEMVNVQDGAKNAIRNDKDREILKELIKRSSVKNEAKQEASGWPQLYAELSKLNSPKIIKWTDADGANVSLNWGSTKEAGHRVGISIKNFDPRVSVVGDDAAKVKAELLKAGLKDEAGDPSWNGIEPKTAIAAITNAVKSNSL